MKALRVGQFVHARQGQPLWLRAANQVGRLAPGLAVPSADAWWEAALAHEPAAVDPAPEAREALDVLVRSIRSDTTLSLIGRISARDDTVRLARTHLRIRQALRHPPAIAETTLPEPIFIVGWPRTGTTTLHQILARDPENRTIPYWESFDPVPPSSGPDLRADRLARMLDQLASMAPSYDAIHPMTADMPEECVALFMNDLRTLQFDIQYHAPQYVEWLLDQDTSIAYTSYRRQLQLIQFHRPAGRRFVLKDPTHLVHLETLLEVFPTAKVIFTHRDPGTALSSLCSLHAYTRALFTNDVDPVALGLEIMDGHWPRAMERALALRDRLRPERYTDVRHPDLVRDPLGTVESTYAALGVPFNEDARRAMTNYIQAEAEKPRHVHEHSPEGFGLSRDGIRARFADYCSDFEI